LLDQYVRLIALYPWLRTAVSVLVTLAGALIVWLLVVRSARRARRHFQELLDLAHDSLDASSEIAAAQRLTALRLVVNAAKYVLVVAAILLVLRQLDVKGVDSLLLPAGFAGAALALGAQNLVKDVVAGLFIVFEGQFAVGDVVKINGTLGTIEEVGLRVTRLLDEAGQIHFFPNGSIATVAKYPNRYAAFLLLVPLADTGQHGVATAVVLKCARAFDARYGAWAEPAEVVSPDATGLNQPGEGGAPKDEGAAVAPGLKLRLLVHPERVSFMREKFPARVASALQAADIQIETGADVEIINAPV